MDLSLKKRIILPLLLSGILVFVLGLYLLNRSEQQQLQVAVQQGARSLQSHIQTMLDARTRMLVSNLGFLAQDEQVVRALQAGDRATLLRLSLPIYQRLHAQAGISHFYFHDLQRVNLLRVHQPGRHGDSIERFTLRAAERTGQVSAGIELGTLGTFTLRAVLPVERDGKRIGYIELGQEIDDQIHLIHELFDVELYVLIDKVYLNRENWQAGMQMLHRPASWERLPSAVLSTQSQSATPPVEWLNQVVSRPAQGQEVQLTERVQFAGREYWSARILLPDVAGRPVASLVVLRDMTSMLDKARQNFLVLTLISLFMGCGILLLFWAILGRTENELTHTRQRLLDESQARAEMHEKFIQQLLEEQDKLSEREAHIKLLLNAVGDGIYGVDGQGNATFVNPMACQMLGYDSSEMLGQNMHDLVHHAYPDRRAYAQVDCPIFDSLQSGKTHRINHEVFWRKDGSAFPVEYVSTPILQDNQPTGAVVVFNDISERKQAQMQIERALHVQRVMDTILNISLPPLALEEVLLLALDAVLSIPTFALLSKGAVFLVDEEGRSLVMVAQRNLPDVLLERCAHISFGRCLCGRAAASREVVFANHINAAHEITFENMTPHGHYCVPILSENKLLGVLNMYIPHNHPGDEDERKYLKTVADTMAVVIKRKRDEETLRRLAHHDTLTSLPNRTLFYDRLEQMLASAQRQTSQFAVVFLDMDRFKEVNDTLGHDAGDLVLKEVARRLRVCVPRKSDTIARMGGDEFTIILTHIHRNEDIQLVAEKIVATLAEPFVLQQQSWVLGSSVGIARYPEHGLDGETLVKHADDAMYLAKKQRNSYRFYGESA